MKNCWIAVNSGFANKAFPFNELDDAVTAIASRITKIPSDLLALNKRSVHRAMEAMGVRDGIRATAEIQALKPYKHLFPGLQINLELKRD